MQEVIKMAAKTKDMELQEVEKQEIVESGAERTRARKAFVPRADIYETDDELVVVADMPGVDENSVEVLVQPENFSLAYAEYEEGDYERSFTLSNEIDLNRIEATVKDGVLRLHLPKIGEAKTKKIAVKAA
jgi:HSP20 family molecular chaperone IbpA